MYYADEVREISEYGKIEGVEVKETEAKLARQLIESLAAPFDPEKYEDSYRKQIGELIEAKLEGREAGRMGAEDADFWQQPVVVLDAGPADEPGIQIPPMCADIRTNLRGGVRRRSTDRLRSTKPLDFAVSDPDPSTSFPQA